MNYKIPIKELQELKERLKTNQTLKDIMPDVSVAILKFHNVLDTRVNEVFANPKRLSTVRIGNTVPQGQLGNTLLRYSLQYHMKAVPLSDYPYQITPSSSESKVPTRIPTTNPLGFVKWKSRKVSEDFKVLVQRSKGYTEQYPAKSRKGSNNAASDKVFGNKRIGPKGKVLANGRLISRYRQTWATRPTYGREGIHTKSMETQYGPTLAYLANTIYDKDAAAQQAKERMSLEISTAFVKWYARHL
jgi:hypothetical protein